MKRLKVLFVLITLFLTACSGAAETATPAASAPTATPIPAEPTATTPPHPTATTPAEPTATDTPSPSATPQPELTTTQPPEPTPEATTELVAEHDASVLPGEHDADVPVAISEPEFTGEAVQAAWQELTPANPGPGPRYEHALQYNAATNQVFLFGGRDGSQVYNDVWALDLATLSWRQLAADAPAAPPTRFSTVMMVDTAAENLYVATGQRQDGSVLNDVWRLNLQTETWEELSAAAGQGPTARYGSAGGNLNDRLVVTHGFGTTRYDDTWLFDPPSGQWQNITPTGEVPLKRCLLAAATNADSLILHGGCSSGFGPCPQDDTWVLDTASQSWRQITGETRPVGRQHHSLTNLAEQSRLILFGGQDASRAARDDTWLLDLSTDSWQPIETTAGPAARYNHQAVWTPAGLLVYGGRNNGPLGDMWVLNLSQ